MDAIALLKEDHKTVEKLFKQFEKLGDGASPSSKKKIVDQVIQLLTEHAHIEESIFYPAAREAAPDTKDHVLESIEEHHVVAWLLSELQGADAKDEAYTAKMTVLMENVRHHVEEEEKEWFPQVRKAMTRKRLQELSDQMQAAKAGAPASPLALPSAASSAKDAPATKDAPAAKAASVKPTTAKKAAATKTAAKPAKTTAAAKTGTVATKAAKVTKKAAKAPPRKK